MPERSRVPDRSAPLGAVVIAPTRSEWPRDLLETISREGYTLVRIDDLRLVLFLVLAGGVSAVIVDGRAMETLGAMALRKCRECSPSTAVVVLALDATPATMKRALESGATAFLSWPASPQVVARALRGGAA